MENLRSDLARGASSSHGSGEEAAAAAGGRKGKKNRAPSPVLVSEGRAAAGTETTGAWTGEKKTKIQGAPTSGDLGGTEQIEGLDWDKDKLWKEIECCRGRLHDGDDDESLEEFDEEQLTLLNRRLAFCRIRAHEGGYRELNDASLAAIYPLSSLEDNGYYKHYERRFEWYFDPEYCLFPELQDYQRLVLRDNGEYEDWEFYRKTCNTHEGDQQFVQFWETLSSKTKLIELYLKDRSRELLVLYHFLKIAGGLPCVFKTLILRSFEEFKESVMCENIWYKNYAAFYFDIWELMTKQKMNFKEAFRQIHDEGKHGFLIFSWKNKFEKYEPNLGFLEHYCKRYLDRIGATAQDDDAYQSIMESVKEFVTKPKTYYDYAKNKLRIAKEIGSHSGWMVTHYYMEGGVGGYSNEG